MISAKEFLTGCKSSEEPEESLTYNKVNSWRSDALKFYCRQRGLKDSGSKQELVARVFAASEMGIPVQPTAEEGSQPLRTSKLDC